MVPQKERNGRKSNKKSPKARRRIIINELVDTPLVLMIQTNPPSSI